MQDAMQKQHDPLCIGSHIEPHITLIRISAVISNAATSAPGSAP